MRNLKTDILCFKVKKLKDKILTEKHDKKRNKKTINEYWNKLYIQTEALETCINKSNNKLSNKNK